ncbi:DUF5696 domain-containing protein [Paenibacillus thermotolerans]|uniref:DUF5696 domain-containing protein n=1 Tax=Paenibacillus thermotolerans TaxID=3027807 RepID=UPI00236806F7|nr:MULTISPECIES: DUF5696 domain-containing protein [unclassified Paenibacillus]
MKAYIGRVIGYAIVAALTTVFILIISQPPAEPEAAKETAKEEAPKELDQFTAESLQLENDRFALRFDGRYGSVHLTDKSTGQTWDSVPELDKSVPPNNQRFIHSPVLVRYTEGKGNTQTYPFKEQGTLKAELIDGGKAIRADIELTRINIAFALVYRLNKDGLEVKIPFDSVKEGANKKLVSIEALPFFEAAKETDEGALVIPDGSGALIGFKEKHPQYFEIYSEFVYGGDHAFQKNVYQKVTENKREMLSYGPRESAALPIYGLYKKDKAFLAVLHDGEEDAKINATPSGVRNIKLYRASAEFIYRNDDVVFLGGSGEIPLTSSAMIPGDRTVRFVLLQEPNANYVGMATAYRNYLIEEKGLKPAADREPTYQLHVFGGVLQTEIIGRKFVTLTTFKEVKEMIDRLIGKGVRKLEVTLEGWSDGGAFGNQPAHLPADRHLGGTKDLRQLSEYAKSIGVQLYVSTNYVKPYKKSGALSRTRDTIRGLNKEVLEVYKPYVTTRQASYELYYLLKPGRVYDRFVSEEAPKFADLGISGVRLGYMGNTLYSDPGSKISAYRKDTLEAWVKSMDLMRESVGRAAVEYGFGYALGHVDRIDGIPLESSHYVYADASIPFYQIAIHGLIPYTAKPSNLRDDPRTEMLKALEYGALPSFALTYRDPVLLKRTMVDDLFSSEFSKWVDSSAEEYAVFETILGRVADQPIVDHEMLAEGVYRTTYGNGVQVLVNYNDAQAVAEDETIPAYGYAVKGGDE